MGYFSRAKAITKSDTINPLPAWEFMNQTGTLGTNLKGSLIYVGGPGDVNVIPAGTEGAQNTVVALTVSDGGSGYTAANNVATTTTGNGSGLTVNTTVVAGAVTAVAIGNSAGTGYKVGDTITISGGGANATLTVDEVLSLAPVVSDGVEFAGLQAGDIITTGTPPGVGMGKKPQIFLKAGDQMKLSIDNLGEQSSKVVPV